MTEQLIDATGVMISRCLELAEQLQQAEDLLSRLGDLAMEMQPHEAVSEDWIERRNVLIARVCAVRVN